MKKLVCIFTLLVWVACSNPGANTLVQEELTKVKTELATAKQNIESLKSQIEPEGELVHIVFFDLKADANADALTAEIKKLEGIEVVKDLQVGPFENLGDQRALSDYDMMMEMSFDNKSDYRTYQAHPIHLALKESAKAFLAAPPATYDYIKD